MLENNCCLIILARNLQIFQTCFATGISFMQIVIKMSERIDEDFVPELPSYAEKLLFAEVLVEYMLFRNCRNYNIKWDRIPSSDQIHNAFDRIIKRLINFLDSTLETDHDQIFFQMQNADFVNSYNYGIFAENLAVKYFPDGFDAKNFLIYCVNLSTMAAYFYSNGIFDAPDLAKKHIFKILQEYGLTAVGWDTVRRIAENYEDMLRDSVNELTPQSLDSDEIEPQDSEQEVSDDESRSSSPNEHNFLSGNEENKLENQQERACLEKDKSLNESAECSSETIPEIGLSPSKEPESLSSEDISSAFKFEGNKRIKRTGLDDKLTPGTSNVEHEKPILIKSDCNISMNLSRNNIKSGNSQTCFAGNKLIDKSASDDRFYHGSSNSYPESPKIGRNECKKRKFDLLLNMKDDEQADTLSFEKDNLIDKNSTNEMFCSGASNTYQISNFAINKSCDLSSDEENGVNYPLMNSGGINVANKSLPNKFVRETQISDQMSVSIE